MKKAEYKETTLTVIIVILCLLFFCLGVSVPMIFDRGTKSEDVASDEKFNAIYDLLREEWYFADEVEDIDKVLLEKAIEGMTDLEEDPHTNYYDLESAQKFSESLEGSNVGLGMSYFLDEDQNFVVKDVFLDSPAEKAGLQTGDVITTIDGQACSQNDSDTLVQRIKDHEGTPLEIVYTHEGESHSITIEPTEYDETVSCQLFEDQGFALLRLTSFSENSGADFAKAMKRIQEAGIQDLILDLRGNTGGYLSAAVDIASSLLPKGSVVVQEEDKDGHRSESKTNDDYDQVKLDQIVILQNATTASASEALIGALKDNLGSVVTTVGTTSYGKGTEQTSVPFSDGTSIKYTIAKWFTPNGESIDQVGFVPDVEVSSSEIENVQYNAEETKNTLEPDTVSVNAKAVQIFLKYLGYSADRTDEYFSAASSEALKLFQKDNALSISGKCDPQTWEKLYQKAMLKYNQDTLYTDQQIETAIDQLEAS